MIVVNDKMQKNYQYELVAPMGSAFADGFFPELTPKEMLELGVFEGHYLTDCQDEFPSSWFEKAKLSFNKADDSCNYYGVKSRLSLAIWQDKGWIYGPDPRGWFQWYCRYYMGRRLDVVDNIQIKRWRAFKRHKAQVEHNCMMFDDLCRIKQRQALLQWAYSPFF